MSCGSAPNSVTRFMRAVLLLIKKLYTPFRKAMCQPFKWWCPTAFRPAVAAEDGVVFILMEFVKCISRREHNVGVHLVRPWREQNAGVHLVRPQHRPWDIILMKFVKCISRREHNVGVHLVRPWCEQNAGVHLVRPQHRPWDIHTHEVC